MDFGQIKRRERTGPESQELHERRARRSEGREEIQFRFDLEARRGMTREVDQARQGVGFRSERGPILAALMVAASLVALEATVMATAVPSVVRDLGGFSQFPWLFSIYLLAQAVTVPIYGRLADIFGRKPIMLVGISLFLLGSIFSGFAWSMPALIVFRGIQGIGAGAVQPMSMTIVGDIYSIAERAKVQGYLASVWAVSSVVGPAIGGLFSQYLSWRWIFFVNIPLCILSAIMLARNFHEKVERRDQRIDFSGAGLLAVGTSLVILGLLEGGQAWAWNSAWSFGTFSLAIVLLVGFVLVEQRVEQPILPLWVFRRRLLLTTSLAGVGSGVVMVGLSSYIPIFSQRVLGVSALLAGFAVAALTIGWPLAAQFVGRVYGRTGFRTTALIGGSIVLVGSLLVLLLGPGSPIWDVAIFCAVIGFGMGWVVPPTSIAAQSSVEWGERGVVTGNNMFSRTVGSAVGVAVFGAIVNATSQGVEPPPAVLNTAMHQVFIASGIVSLAMLVAVSFMPRDQSGRSRVRSTTEGLGRSIEPIP